jgi:amino acid adenylation domain-containing protein
MTVLDGRLKPPAGFNPFPAESLEQSVLLRFEQAVRLYPDHLAVTDHEGSLTYRALNHAANGVAQRLLELFGTGDDPVALLQGHDISAVVTILGILKTGRPYVALHPAHPPDSLLSTLSAAGPVCLIGSRPVQPLIDQLPLESAGLRAWLLEDLRTDQRADNPGIYVPPQAAFSIVYTSGSTGEPKGLVLNHRYVNFCAAHETNSWFLSPQDRISLLTSMSYGAAFANLMGALLNGGTVCLYDFKARGGDRVMEWILYERISVLRLTPSMFRAVFERAPRDLILPEVRIVTLGGEPAKTSDFNLFKDHTAPGCVLVNVFASTEASKLAVCSFDHDSVLSGEFLPAGYPIDGKEVLLLDDDGQAVAPGQPGEIVVRSRYLSPGYWKEPALTAGRFKPDPQDPGMTLLFSGDLGRWNPDGSLESLGRKDLQVKIRGYRVDLADVEAVLLENPRLREAAVVAHPSRHQPDQLHLVAYVVPHPGHAIDPAALGRELARKLPDYMIPAFFVSLDRLPLNVNGKVDRQALPGVPDRDPIAPSNRPASPAEEKLAAIWAGLLKVDRVGVHDNFFELGGDSLLMLSMTLEVEKAFAGRFPGEFFKEPTVHKLASLFEARQAAGDERVGAFILQPKPGQGSAAGWRLRTAALRLALKRLVKKLTVIDGAFLFEWLLSRIIRGLSFDQAVRLILRLSGRRLLLHTVYDGKHRLFRRLLRSLERDDDMFGKSFLHNILAPAIQARKPFYAAGRTGARDSKFFRERRALIEDTPADRLDERFPVEGLEILHSAYAAGRGAILLSFHGTPANWMTYGFLARRLGSPKIQTISHNIPLQKSSLDRIKKDSLPPATLAWLYAEIAYHGQQLLKQGGIVHIASDFGTTGPGLTYALQVGDRVYSIKAGFAELSLNTGAPLIPVFGRILEDGRVLTVLLPPLDPGPGARTQQIEALVRQYGEFMDHTFRRHPEILTWDRIRKHFRQPSA